MSSHETSGDGQGSGLGDRRGGWASLLGQGLPEEGLARGLRRSTNTTNCSSYSDIKYRCRTERSSKRNTSAGARVSHYAARTSDDHTSC